MAFKQFSTQDEFWEIIHSVNNTLLIDYENIEKTFQIIQSFGFIKTEEANKGQPSYIWSNDKEQISISFSQPLSNRGICFLMHKSFKLIHNNELVLHRANNKPAFIIYHSNGNKHSEQFKVKGTDYSEVVLDDGIYPNLLHIITTKNKRSFYFKQKNMQAYVATRHGCKLKGLNISYYINMKYVSYEKLVKLYPELASLSFIEKIDLNASLSKAGLGLIEILLYE